MSSSATSSTFQTIVGSSSAATSQAAISRRSSSGPSSSSSSLNFPITTTNTSSVSETTFTSPRISSTTLSLSPTPSRTTSTEASSFKASLSSNVPSTTTSGPSFVHSLSYRLHKLNSLQIRSSCNISTITCNQPFRRENVRKQPSHARLFFSFEDAHEWLYSASEGSCGWWSAVHNFITSIACVFVRVLCTAHSQPAAFAVEVSSSTSRAVAIFCRIRAADFSFCKTPTFTTQFLDSAVSPKSSQITTIPKSTPSSGSQTVGVSAGAGAGAVASPDGQRQGSTTESFSTVTDRPQSTFSIPVSVLVTQKDGQTVLSSPSFITSLSPSTASDGIVVQVTHVIANPGPGLSAVEDHSFFDNRPAVIGVFLATGVIATALVVAVIYFCRRHRKRGRADRLERLSPTLHFNPFSDPGDSPSMSEARHAGPSWQTRNTSRDTFEPDQEPRRSAARLSGGILSITDETRPTAEERHYEGPFSDYHSPKMVHAFSNEEERNQARSHSRATSSPSLYPPSSHAEEEDSLYEREIRTSRPPPSVQIASADYVSLQRSPVSSRPSTQDSQLNRLNVDHPPMTPTTPSSHTHVLRAVESPVSSEGTYVASNASHDEKQSAAPSMRPPPIAFLRRTYSKKSPLNGSSNPEGVSSIS
ncbi:hypothetical protein OF83DRAFT_541087 [Amylostereum chailletii]|nr:hypothetical protein OF83DRAFT_541087 [Amylostereum chailletii]